MGGGIEGKIIYPPEEMMHYMDAETGVVITSINNQYEIAQKLVEEIKIPSDQIFMYTSPYYEAKIYKEEMIQKNIDKVIAYAKRFADAESQEYYINAFNARLQRNPLLLVPNPKCRKKGDYGSTVCLKKGDIIIDCGAYTGDTAEMYMEQLNNECNIYAIEPFVESYEKLKGRIQQNGWENNVKPFNCAVGNTADQTTIKFDLDEFAMGISISQEIGNKSQSVKVETLDHLFGNQVITYIKMDIEGEEARALAGARKLIQNNNPRLMISGYHKIEDFWEIPEMIWSINANYRIYVGHAPGVSTELEYYCIVE